MSRVRYRWQQWVLFFLSGIARGLFRFSLTGEDRLQGLPDSVIVAADHHSYFDPFSILVVLPRKRPFLPTRPLAWQGLFWVPFLNLFLWTFGCIAVQTGRKAPLDQALRVAHSALSRNESLLIFPEGKRTKDRIIQNVRRGTPYLALTTGKAVLPIALHGAQNGISLFSLLKRPRILVKIGEPIRFPQEPAPTPEHILAAGESIRAAIAACQADNREPASLSNR